MPNNGDATYKFVCTGEQREQLKVWAVRAAERGISTEYLEALKAIYHQLTTNPLTWGDPWYSLNHLGLQIYQRACTPLHVSYAVDAARRIVFVRRFTLVSGSVLEEDG